MSYYLLEFVSINCVRHCQQTQILITAFPINRICTVRHISIEIIHGNKGNSKITELRQSYKGKVKTHKYINRQNQSTTGKL